MNDDIVFHIGEVVENKDPDTTYTPGELDKKNLRFCITVNVMDRNIVSTFRGVSPISSNILQIPIVGEFVYIIGTKSKLNDSGTYQWYYFPSINSRSDVNQNFDSINRGSIDEKFITKTITPKQPYRGDLLINGRWGNCIRLGSTVKPDPDYTIENTWPGNSVGDPIIILSNSTKTESKYQIEDISKDESSIYLTSTQKINNLSLGSKTRRNPLTVFLPNESAYEQSQFIGVADRIILKAKTDIVVLDSPTAIVLNTKGKVKIGSDSADVRLPHGDVLYEILQKIINQLNTPIVCGSMVGTFTSKRPTKQAQRKLKKLLSTKYFITKT
jgi:hypothetical protein